MGFRSLQMFPQSHVSAPVEEDQQAGACDEQQPYQAEQIGVVVCRWWVPEWHGTEGQVLKKCDSKTDTKDISKTGYNGKESARKRFDCLHEIFLLFKFEWSSKEFN